MKRVVDACNKERTDLLLIAGDLFHRQPLLRELKEVNSLFATLKHTQVVLVAGNHDYLKKDSYYRTFRWARNVQMILSEDISCVEFPQLSLAVYGCSYHSREIKEAKYDNAFAGNKQRYEILIAHGGDEKHIPIQRNKIKALGYDYVALGHIHKPQVFQEEGAAYAGAWNLLIRMMSGLMAMFGARWMIKAAGYGLCRMPKENMSTWMLR